MKKNIIPYNLQTITLLCAFRYALGRSTYIPKDIVSAIIHAWPDLDEFTRCAIKSEIHAAIRRKQAGMDIDVKEWEKILELEI